MKNLHPDAMLERLEWRRDIRNLMGRISADYSVREEGQIYARYWSRREDVCLGVNEGWYVGPDAVADYYQALDEEIMLSAKCVQKDFPEKLEGLTDEALKGVGVMSYIPVDSHVIEIADDGQTAKGLFNIRGSYNRITTSGPIAYWLFGWAAADFILEDGQWRIWHLLFLRDVDHTCGESWAEPERPREILPEFAAMAEYRVPEPTVKKTLWTLYAPRRPHLAPPRIPEPYDTFDHTFSYGAEGGIL